ncbi:MAG: DUF362 domain-containing protein [Bryobacteraceae bacterium]|jgi:uncharacterized protein (DUF362 family)
MPLDRAAERHTGRWYLPVLGLLSLAWFLFRVLPKPSRASYPCQRAAAPVAAGFVTWLAGVVAPVVLLRKVRRLSTIVNPRAAGALIVLAMFAAGMCELMNSSRSLEAFDTSGAPYKMMDGPLAPVGTGRGIAPGRVVWVRDPNAVSWNMTGSWWEEKYNNQAAIDGMVSRSLQWLSNEKSDAKAWSALFRYFNRRHGRGDVGYQPSEKIAIKVNLNNTTDHGATNRLNTSPHLTLALVSQLVNAGHVKPSDITVMDPSRFIPSYLYDKIHALYPDVVLVDHIGGDGRVKADFRMNAIPFSIPGRNCDGIATAVLEATYLIDASVLKGHVGSGVTLSAKNLFGLTSINPDWHKNAHDHFSQNRDGTPSYSTFTDFLGHKDLGEKTMLFLMDALYANDLVDDPPHLKWKMAPFNDNWPASLFASQDGVALDSVSLDFLRSEWPRLADLSYADNYMREAALADNPPSGTFYDPQRGGVRCTSLGVHEHWNNAIEKQYSRNLGKKQGIELYTGPM